MKILALIGSPRKGGNTETLADRVIEAAVEAGHTAEKIRLYDHEILPCIDCRGCKRGDFRCVLDDGMKEIYPVLDEADVVIFGTPVYWYGPTAKMKLLLDRFRPYIASGRLKAKRGIIVSPSEEGPGCCAPLLEIFRMSFDYVGMIFEGSVLASGYERGDVLKDTPALQKAWEIGSSLSK